MRFIPFLILAFMALAGCFGDNAGGDSDGTTGTAAATSQTRRGPGDVQPLPAHALSFTLNDCYGIFTQFAWAPTLGPGQTPPGWEEDLVHLGSNTNMAFHHCTRVSWGAFERPMSLFLE